MDTFYYSSPVGILELKSDNNQITQLLFKDSAGVSSEVLSDVMKECIHQLDEYFAGQRQNFSVPLSPEGTDFQKSVWDALLTIPYGQTISYKQLAERVQNPKACRAVGTANGRNPIAIIIPCHRVIAANGTLGGYAGGLDLKTTLLKLEGIDRF